jgi:multiple sugar transport system substrate-binding protein
MSYWPCRPATSVEIFLSTWSSGSGGGQPAAGGGPKEVTAWLKDVGGPFKGQTIHVVSEATPPSRAIFTMAQQEFEPATGMQIRWELLPLDQVLQKISTDVAGRQGQYDMLYLDQAWIARFKNDTVDPKELYQSKRDLQFPKYDWEDFLQPLVQHVGTWQDKLVGIPCDIPIFITMYRKDLFDKAGMQVPTTMADYLSTIRTLNQQLAPKVYGTVGQLQSGYYSLECDWTAWLWSHGGSVFNPGGECVVDDDNGIAGLEYLMALKENMPPGATTWTWDGQANAFAQGKGAIYTSWGEYFPLYNTPEKSTVVGKVYPADPPKEASLRTPRETGFEEHPGIAHQGGSVYALNRYSKRRDATWVFLQWATSSDVQTRASLLGGGASPMRQSTFDDPRVKAKQKPGGLTQHFPVQERAIKERMGTEPHLPPWPEIANDVFAVELGRLVTKQQDIRTTARRMKQGADRLAAKYRSQATT